MGSGFSKMKKQARMLQQQYDQIQEEMKTLIVTGVAGNGLVEMTMNGDKELLDIKIKPDCVDKEDIEGLQDLILSACRDAHQKIKETQTSDEQKGNGQRTEHRFCQTSAEIEISRSGYPPDPACCRHQI